MSGIDCIADTNALIYLLAGNLCMKPYLAKMLGFSVISEMELLSFSGIISSDEQRIKSLIEECCVFPLSENIKNKAITLCRTHKIKIPDAIIAATAIEHKLPLITADKDFKQILELDLILLEPVIPQ
ncbi:type II toxin-antitoxin system VapC family toxin [Treponema lecithinolyticum]|uniref:type II toxin-antitoxin system VapC family toxin n=1 Tax=Treponema lecithinolyticum TaxID=53418 RepID=UPI003FA1BB66